VSQDETIEVPAMRPARVRLVGRALEVQGNAFFLGTADRPDPGSCFVVRPTKTRGEPFRTGMGMISGERHPWTLMANATAIPAFRSGDYVYLLEE